ncbi:MULTISPECIES: hypothetical protein [Paenibacillus]|uniref:hypothetical protein n=1 Tax=Paenibacillus TaxID=44249 RepID=UPI0022B8B81F|nr:hypothetical protein [Paenibacillus caseinilyticus]MCZ8519352.1 hypothetical protein [Paenibacillus caseinilyticus]
MRLVSGDGAHGNDSWEQTRIAELRHEELGGNPMTVFIGLHTFTAGTSKEALFEGPTELYTK